MAGDQWVDLYTAAEEMNITRQTLYRLLDQFEVERFRRPGQRRVVIRRADLERMKEPIPVDALQRGRPRGSLRGKSVAAT